LGRAGGRADGPLGRVHGKVGRKYALKPSEYVSRNVRVTPFWNENLPLMIERYGIEDA